MKLLYILLGVFAITLFGTKLFTRSFNYSLSGRIAMSLILVITAIGHVVYTKGMILMMPDVMPFKKELVYITGIIEFCAAVGLLIPRFQHLTAWLLILFLLLILPANIHATLKHVDFTSATYTGPGVSYLWIRIPLQAIFIAWTYYFAIRL